LLLLGYHLLATNTLGQPDSAWFDDPLDISRFSAHLVIPRGILVMIGVPLLARHATMVAIYSMCPTVWLSISVGDIAGSSSTARAAGAVGRAAAAAFISVPFVLVASSLLLPSTMLLPRPSTIVVVVVVVLVIIVGLGECGILGRRIVCICCHVLLHHH